jgi:hypothetical protein
MKNDWTPRGTETLRENLPLPWWEGIEGRGIVRGSHPHPNPPPSRERELIMTSIFSMPLCLFGIKFLAL